MMNAYQVYQQNSVMLASPEKLVLMLYDGLLRFIRLGKKSLEERDFESANDCIVRAQEIVSELNVSLNMDYEISHSLRSLYNFMYQKLIEANIKKDISIIEQVEHLVSGLKEAWEQAYVSLKGNGTTFK